MAKVLDVTAYILSQKGPMTAMKLQKLVYYAQAWNLVWNEKLLFHNKIEAWANGPVVPTLYTFHRGEFRVSRIAGGNKSRLTAEEKAAIDSVVKFYGDKSSQWLSDLTHLERPWREAREGLKMGERGHREITPTAMAEYYGSL